MNTKRACGARSKWKRPFESVSTVEKPSETTTPATPFPSHCTLPLTGFAYDTHTSIRETIVKIILFIKEFLKFFTHYFTKVTNF